MFPSLHGRIDRKTYIVGNLLALAVLFVFCCLVVIPVAIISLVVASKTFDSVVSIVYLLLILPAILYYFYFSVLIIKRAHDIGYPGFLIVIVFTLLMGLGRMQELWFLNIVGMLLIALFCLKAGVKARNRFGAVPRKKFNIDNLKITF